MHFHMMNKRHSISTYFIYRNIYFFLNSISNSFWIFFKYHRFIIFLKRITISKKSSSPLFLIQVCLKIRTREEVGITDRLSTRMELASIEVRNHPFSCLPHFNAVLTATFHDSSLLSPNRSRNSLSRRRFSRSYLFEGKN